MLKEHQKHWGVDQWAAFLSGHPLPCMLRSKSRLLEIEAAEGDSISARDLADIAVADPFLCVHLLREAESHRAQRLGHETTTPLGAVMQLPGNTVIDRPLPTGAALFGIGWGLAGFCPGPALMNLSTLQPQVALFVAAMVVGMLAQRLWAKRANKA